MIITSFTPGTINERVAVRDPGPDEVYGNGDDITPLNLYPTENVRDVDIADDNSFLIFSHFNPLNPQNYSIQAYEFGDDGMPNTGGQNERYASIPFPQAGSFTVRSLQAEGFTANTPPWGSSPRASEKRATALLIPVVPPGPPIILFAEAGNGGFATGDEQTFFTPIREAGTVGNVLSEMNNTVFVLYGSSGRLLIEGVKWGPY